MDSISSRFFTGKMLPIAACMLCTATSGLASEPPAIRATIEGRAADYERQDPGVPVWPSTCDCISVDFGFKDSRGNRPMRFSFADAPKYYGQDTEPSATARQTTMAAKGPLKTLVVEEATEFPEE